MFVQDGTAALCQMLKIGQTADSSKDQHQGAAQRNYGKQVSVQELFQGETNLYQAVLLCCDFSECLMSFHCVSDISAVV